MGACSGDATVGLVSWRGSHISPTEVLAARAENSQAPNPETSTLPARGWLPRVPTTSDVETRTNCGAPSGPGTLDRRAPECARWARLLTRTDSFYRRWVRSAVRHVRARSPPRELLGRDAAQRSDERITSRVSFGEERIVGS